MAPKKWIPFTTIWGEVFWTRPVYDKGKKRMERGKKRANGKGECPFRKGAVLLSIRIFCCQIYVNIIFEEFLILLVVFFYVLC